MPTGDIPVYRRVQDRSRARPGPPHLSRGSGKPACYTAVEAAQSSCGEMSERLKEHAWKLSGLGATDSYRRRPTRAIRATYHQRCSLGSTPYHPVFLDCQPRLRHNPRHNPPATRRRPLAGADSPQSPGAAATDDTWERTRLRHLKPDVTEAQLTELLRGRFYRWFEMATRWV